MHQIGGTATFAFVSLGIVVDQTSGQFAAFFHRHAFSRQFKVLDVTEVVSDGYDERRVVILEQLVGRLVDGIDSSCGGWASNELFRWANNIRSLCFEASRICALTTRLHASILGSDHASCGRGRVSRLKSECSVALCGTPLQNLKYRKLFITEY